MALSPRLDLRQAQTLVMTPQLQQAIKLLQLSNVELSEYVEQQLEQNPLLQREEGALEREQRSDVPSESSEPSEAALSMHGVDRVVKDEAGVASADGLDGGYENIFEPEMGGVGDGEGNQSVGEHGTWDSRRSGGEGFDADLENVLAGGTSLREHLASQIAIDIVDPVDRMIGLYMIEALDESGYLQADAETVAAQLNCAPGRVAAVIERLQQIDPPGIFARDLSECLAIQLRARGRLTSPMRNLLQNLDLVAMGDLNKLAKACGVSVDAAVCLIEEVKKLNPRPASAFDVSAIQPIVPDLIMRSHHGGWLIELNNETLPRVLVDNQYYSRISRSAAKKEDREYISECYQSANWLVKSLHQRATTIIKVASEIVRQQEAFFAKGVQGLRPLILRDIASAVDMHESTVSRVTSNKYIATPRGIYELKYFFSQAIGGGEGSTVHSAESVRHRIKKLIDQEAPDAVLSDDMLVEVLQTEGIDIARRTVAKYRESMGLPSSVQRRRRRMAGV